MALKSVPVNVRQAMFDHANGDDRTIRELARRGGLASGAKRRARSSRKPKPFQPSRLDHLRRSSGERDDD